MITFGELKNCCNKVSGSLYTKNSKYTDEVFFYYVFAVTEDDDDNPLETPYRFVCIVIDSYDEKTITHETAKEICDNLTDKHNYQFDATDDMEVKVLYTDTFAEVVKIEISENNVYLITE